MKIRDRFPAIPRHAIPLIATVFVLLFLWLSAVPLVSWYEFTAQHQVLRDAAFNWHQERIEDYSFELDFTASASGREPGRMRIHVRNSEFVAAYRADDGQEINTSALPEIPLTIDAVFEFAAALLENRPYEIDMAYDAALHYPTRISARFGGADAELSIYRFGSLRRSFDDR